MICPRCASNQTDNVKFCTFCGANLEAVREVLAPRDPDKKFNWNDTWVAEMTMKYGDEPWYGVSIVEFDGPRIARMTDYFGPAFPAPAWRAQWVEREDATA